MKLAMIACILFSTFAAQAGQRWGKAVAWGYMATAAKASNISVSASWSNIVQMSGDSGWLLGLRNDGTMVADGGTGKPFDAVPTNNNVQSIGTAWYVGGAILSNGTVIEWQGLNCPAAEGTNLWYTNGAPAIGTREGITNAWKIAGGDEHLTVLRSNGTIVSWGSANRYSEGEVCYTNSYINLSNIVDIACTWYSVVVLSNNGRPFQIGRGAVGEDMTIPAGATNGQRIYCGTYAKYLLRSNGTVVAWGLNTSNQCSVPEGLTNVVALSPGIEHCIAIKADGTTIHWGSTQFVTDPPPAYITNLFDGWGRNHYASFGLKNAESNQPTGPVTRYVQALNVGTIKRP